MFFRVVLVSFIIFHSNVTKAADTTTVCSGKLDKSGNKTGYWICRKNQLIVRKEKYKSNQLVSYMLFDKKGKIIETMNKKGRVKKYSSCGCY
jgi:hypothetical protein